MVRQKLNRKPMKQKVIKKYDRCELSNRIIDSAGFNPFKIADPQSVIYGIKNINSPEIESDSSENLLMAPRPRLFQKVNYWKKIAETIRDENDILQNELGKYKGNFFKEFLSRGDGERDTTDPMDKSYLEYLEIENRRFELASDEEKNIKPTKENPKLKNPKNFQATKLLFENSRDISDNSPENTSNDESLGEESDEEVMQTIMYK